ncbi:MAG: DUF4031 domain-containing protein [Nocardioidaceae bacterium]
MGLFIDPPAWPAHGRVWSHLVSDSSIEELHAFAAAHGIPRRGFERDHYDVPADAYERLIAAGATVVSSRDVVRRLVDSGLRRPKRRAMARRALGNELLRPRHLVSGDLVAIPATAGLVSPERLAAGVARLESWGLRVRVSRHVFDTHGDLTYLAGHDVDRATDFEAAWADPDVSAVMLARGGYGTQRMLGLLDWKRLAEAEPKVLCGFSDVTALHQACASRLGLVTIHSHVATSLGVANDSSVESLRQLVMEQAPALDLFAGSDVQVVVGGRSEGVLVGGNLALLVAEIGTPYSRPARGGLALLEDVTEEPYRIDRMLTQLLRAGWFDGVAGVVLGQFTDCGDPALVDAVLVDRLAPLNVPLVKGFDFGHTPTATAVPLGVRAALNADRGTLRLRQPALD